MLYQLSYSRSRSLVQKMVVGEGFEPSKAYAGRFTVCSRWPLGYPTENRLQSVRTNTDDKNSRTTNTTAEH